MSDKALTPRRSKAAAFAIWSLVLLIVANLVSIGVSAGYAGTLADLQAGVDVSYEEAVAADDRVALAALVLLAATVLAAIGFVVWFRRTWITQYEHGDQNLRFSRGWATGSWFVPVLNLWRPKQMANDLWRGTAPDSALEARDGAHERPLSALVTIWWLVWIVAGVVGNVATRSLFQAQTLAEQQKANDLSMVTDSLTVLSAVFAIAFVRALTRRQERRFAREAPAAYAPPVAVAT